MSFGSSGRTLPPTYCIAIRKPCLIFLELGEPTVYHPVRRRFPRGGPGICIFIWHGSTPLRSTTVDCLQPGGASLKIFDGFEEIEILTWHECTHLHFSSRSSALAFLQHFRVNQAAMDSLRRLVRERGHGVGLQISNDYQILDQVAQMLATEELHAVRKPPVFGTGTTASEKEAAPPQPAPEPPRREAEAPPPPPPDEPVFIPNVDPAAMAQVLTQAAQGGAPFCEE